MSYEVLVTAGISGPPGGNVPYFDTAQALRDYSYPTAGAVAVTLGALTKGDGGSGTWYWDASSEDDDNLGTVLVSTGYVGIGRWIRVRESATYFENIWFGPGQDGIQAMFDAYRSLADGIVEPWLNGHLVIVPGSYAITQTIDAHPIDNNANPYAQTTITMEGVYCTTDVPDGVVFKIHNDETVRLNEGTKRRVTWIGGTFRDVSVDGSSTLFDVRFGRFHVWERIYATGYKNFVQLCQLDSYFLTRCYIFDCERVIYVPKASDILGTTPLFQDVLIAIYLTECQFTSIDHVLYARARYNDFHMTNCSANTDSVGPLFDVEYDDDDAVLLGINTKITGMHCEQTSGTVAKFICSKDGSFAVNEGLFNVSFEDCYIVSPNWTDETIIFDFTGVRTGTVRNCTIRNGLASVAPTFIKVNDPSNVISLTFDNNMFINIPFSNRINAAIAWESRRSFKEGPSYVQYAVPINILPATNITAQTDVVMYTADFDAEAGPVRVLKPNAYHVRLEVYSPTSESISNAAARVYTRTDVGINTGLSVSLKGVANNRVQVVDGIVSVDPANDTLQVHNFIVTDAVVTLYILGAFVQ